jgi:uncharacterized repeat protein (TIGR01451 family)
MVFRGMRSRVHLAFVSLLCFCALAHGATEQLIEGKPWTGANTAVRKTTHEIMTQVGASEPPPGVRLRKEREIPGRENRKQDPRSPRAARWPLAKSMSAEAVGPQPSAPQVLGTSFTGGSLGNTGSFPPDSMGAVGPSQFVVFINGLIRTFNKTTGVADGVLNVNSDVFFSSVMTPAGPAHNFTTDPQVRYDRLTNRWILSIIDAPSTKRNVGVPNRVLLAVSDAGSAGTITASTAWSFYFVQQNTVGGGDTGESLDYDSLGVDQNALYIGGSMFGAASGTFINTSLFVVRKTSLLDGGPLVVTAFRGLINNGDGPDSPRGVDNYDANATEGYIIGASDSLYGRLILRRIVDPGGTPAISPNIPITVNATEAPIAVDHFGNNNGANGRLDALDDRLFAAQIRNGRLWTAHNIAVDASGVAASAGARRDAVRWYELDVPAGSGTPGVIQSGTIFDSTASAGSARQYWIPSVAISGQGHAALGFSTAGAPFHIDAATCGRLAPDVLGATAPPVLYTASAGAYNPPDDTGSSSGRRWGDYSFTSVDPQDDMTMWTIQEFCDTTNSFGVRAVKLIAPPPAAPSSSAPSNVDHGASNTDVVITGTPNNGSGFFDPGNGFAKHLTGGISGSGLTINSVRYTDPTHITLNLTVSASAPLGGRTITVTNPDGQAATSASGIVTISPQANLDISQTVAPAPVAAGYHVTYHLSVKNNGPDPASNVVVTETLPAQAGFVSATPQPASASGTQVTFNLGSLASGASDALDITVKFSSSASGTLLATAQISSSVDDLNTGNNSASTPTAVLADSDGDGIPDQWETAHGLNPADPNDASADADGDGYGNLQEYLAGTDPHSAASFWSAKVQVSAADVHITFNTVAGATYRVDAANDLTSPSWGALATGLVGTGQSMTVIDSNAAVAPAKFYRVTVSR